jgi:regulator of nucleoside diphosphate kinase
VNCAGAAHNRLFDPKRKEPTMKTEDTLITEADRRRLESLIVRLKASGRVRRRHLAALDRRLRRSQVIKPAEIPRNVVTLNSRITLKDLDSRNRLHCILVEPHNIAFFGDKISVAAPAGIALLGKRVGQIVCWPLGARLRRFRIEQVPYQPEAAGDFHL